MELEATINSWISYFFMALIAGIVFFSIILFFAWRKKKKNETAYQYNLTFLHIKVPSTNEYEIKIAETFFSNLIGLKKSFWQSLFSDQYRISFEIVSKSDGIGFYVVVPDEIAALVEKQINAAYPEAEIDIVNPQEIWDRGEYTKVAELKLKGANYYPIKDHEDIKNDPLKGITSAMSKMGNDEVLALQYIIAPASDAWRLAGRSFVTRIKNSAANPEKKSNVDTSFLEKIEKKIANPGFYTKIRIVSIAKDPFAAETLIQNAINSFEQFSDVNYNKFVRRTPFSNKRWINNFVYRKMDPIEIAIPVVGTILFTNVSVLNTVELATIFHMPNKDTGTPKILWLTARKASAPANVPSEGLYLGKNIFRGVEKPIFMNEKDRSRHFYIIGQTGTGKSVLMKWLALQDIKNGEGLAIIDPHGTDISDLLPQIPRERIDDVIYFDASDTERPLGINLLEAHSEEEKHMVINSFIALLYKLYDPNHQGIMGPQLERSIRNCMLTAMADPTSTMIDVMRLLIDGNYYKKFLPMLNDPLVTRYWTDEMANTSDYHKSEKMGYMVSKFDRFVTDRTMRNIIGQPTSAFNFPDIMAQKKILLIDLAKGKLGEENSTFLGLLLVPRILAAALQRHKLIGTDFPNFYLYVDEFQNFATPDFATILSEARKYKLNLIVGHQFIDQLEDDIKEAIFGNVGTMATFRVGSDDAEFLKTQFEPTFTDRDLINLPIFNSYTKLLIDGHPSPPFSLVVDTEKTFSQPSDPDVEKTIIQNSRMKYGKSAEEVEKFITKAAGIEEPKVEEFPALRPKLPF